VPVDSLLFGTDGMKALRESGDYTKILIGNPRIRNRIPRFPGQLSNKIKKALIQNVLLI
jgi:hypothetical protein